MARPPSKRRNATRRTRVSTETTLRVNGGGNTSDGSRLGQAAEKIAGGIKEYSSSFSRKIPPSVHVGQGSATHATVYADAPNAYPIETGSRHPVFGMIDKKGNRVWAKEPMKQIRFMEIGAGLKLDDAAEVYGYGSIDDWLRELDW